MVEVIWEDLGACRRLSGEVSYAELDSSAAKLQGDIRTDSLRYIVHDFTLCTEVVASQSELEFLVARACMAIRNIQKLIVIFVGTHPVIQSIFDIRDELQMHLNEWRRFDNWDDARGFISISVPKLGLT